jgi:hypothetical protein
MYRSKILSGVLQLITPGGTRYLQATFFERLYLLWTFRNFPILPQTVLNARQRRLLEKLLVRRSIEKATDELIDRPVIGTIERSDRRLGVFGVAHELSPRTCNQPVGWSSRRG